MFVTKKELNECRYRFEMQSLMMAIDRYLYLDWYKGVGGGFTDEEWYLEDELKICKGQIRYYMDKYFWYSDGNFQLRQMYKKWKEEKA